MNVEPYKVQRVCEKCDKFLSKMENITSLVSPSSAPYTCITFPFLFAVMFGDAGHGLIMFFFGLWMVIKEKSLSAMKSSNEIWNTFFGGRYIIMLMGIFSFYTGVIYNDAFSKSFNIFGSQWDLKHAQNCSAVIAQGHFVNLTDEHTLESNEKIQIDPQCYHSKTAYMVGVDPIWQSAGNKIMFLNSLKMKMAIVLGVIHMLFGVCLSIFNHM